MLGSTETGTSAEQQLLSDMINNNYMHMKLHRKHKK